MSVTLILDWVLFVVVAAVVGRLLGVRRGGPVAAGLALFWCFLAITGGPPPGYPASWLMVSLTASAGLIVLIGIWSAGGRESESSEAPAPLSADAPVESVADAGRRGGNLGWVQAALRDFAIWMDRYRQDQDPWPAFGEFLRGLVHQLCGAARVRFYRILSEGDVLVPLHAIDPKGSEECVSARRGIVGYVATSGRTYVAGHPGEGELVRQLADEETHPVGWAFAVKQDGRTIGLATVGHLPGIDASRAADREKLATLELLIGQFWMTLGETCRSRALATTDPVSGLLTREAFLEAANEILAECYRNNEPVAVVVIAVEGLRALDDSGRWTQVHAFVSRVGRLVSRKCRSHDCLGRFDDSRFLLLLRRVDSELAKLIVQQLLSNLQRIGPQDALSQDQVGFRCGVAGSGLETPDLTTLIHRATAHCHQARRLVLPFHSDLDAEALTQEAVP